MEPIKTSVEVCGIALTARISAPDAVSIGDRGVKYKRNTYNIDIGLRQKNGKWSVDYTCSSIICVPSGKGVSASVTDAINDGALAAVNELARTKTLLFQEAHLRKVAILSNQRFQPRPDCLEFPLGHGVALGTRVRLIFTMN